VCTCSNRCAPRSGHRICDSNPEATSIRGKPAQPRLLPGVPGRTGAHVGAAPDRRRPRPRRRASSGCPKCCQGRCRMLFLFPVAATPARIGGTFLEPEAVSLQVILIVLEGNPPPAQSPRRNRLALPRRQVCEFADALRLGQTPGRRRQPANARSGNERRPYAP
jgi:hypothetical protein